jgi:general secretion pathway protein G
MTYKKIIRGFTMVELLIVIVIIGILSTISLFALAGTRESSRDARRKSDLESIRSALELYKADCGEYIPTLEFPAPGNQLTGATCPTPNSNIYMQSVPGDPLGSPVGTYYYNRPNANTYSLCARLEVAPTTPGCTTADCGTAGLCNVLTTNP